jgi:hypothetical protein
VQRWREKGVIAKQGHEKRFCREVVEPRSDSAFDCTNLHNTCTFYGLAYGLLTVTERRGRRSRPGFKRRVRPSWPEYASNFLVRGSPLL